MPNHDKGVNAIEYVSYVSTVKDLTTPLMFVKEKLLQAGLFSGYAEDCYYCASQSNGSTLLKKGIQCLMDDNEILFEKIPLEKTPYVESASQDLNLEDVSTISGTL